MKSYEEREVEAQAIYQAGLQKVATTPMPKGQKFPPGSRVRIADNGNVYWRARGKLATVEHTYAHAYWGDNIKSYALTVDDLGSVAWFDESDLTALVENQNALKTPEAQLSE